MSTQDFLTDDVSALSNARSNLRYAPHFLVRASDKALTSSAQNPPTSFARAFSVNMSPSSEDLGGIRLGESSLAGAYNGKT